GVTARARPGGAARVATPVRLAWRVAGGGRAPGKGAPLRRGAGVGRQGFLHRHRRTADDTTPGDQPGDDERGGHGGGRHMVTDDEPVVADDGHGVTRGWRDVDTTGDVVPPEARPGWVRVSGLATVGLIISVAALGATLTGLLAPEGLVLGAIGGLVSLGGLAGASRPGVTGHSLAILGLLAGLAAVVLALLAMTGDFSWPNSRVDDGSRLHHWLVAHWSWLGRWS